MVFRDFKRKLFRIVCLLLRDRGSRKRVKTGLNDAKLPLKVALKFICGWASTRVCLRALRSGTDSLVITVSFNC
jgi:hypothetical protein